MKQAGGRVSSPGAPEANQTLRSRRQQEFEEVALVYLDRMYHMALRRCRHRSAAEDLVRETYLRAFRHFDQFMPGTNCRAWLFAILHNTFRDWVEGEGREALEFDEGKLKETESGSSELTATITNPEEEFFRQVEDKDLVEAVDQLPVRLQEVLLLADVEEFSYKEIAEICGVPVETVMSRLSRGRRLLRKVLERSQLSFENHASQGFWGEP